jgi:hypothetical protein
MRNNGESAAFSEFGFYINHGGLLGESVKGGDYSLVSRHKAGGYGLAIYTRQPIKKPLWRYTKEVFRKD